MGSADGDNAIHSHDASMISRKERRHRGVIEIHHLADFPDLGLEVCRQVEPVERVLQVPEQCWEK